MMKVWVALDVKMKKHRGYALLSEQHHAVFFLISKINSNANRIM